jgi:hypothetical protein
VLQGSIQAFGDFRLRISRFCLCPVCVAGQHSSAWRFRPSIFRFCLRPVCVAGQILKARASAAKDAGRIASVFRRWRSAFDQSAPRIVAHFAFPNNVRCEKRARSEFDCVSEGLDLQLSALEEASGLHQPSP